MPSVSFIRRPGAWLAPVLVWIGVALLTWHWLDSGVVFYEPLEAAFGYLRVSDLPMPRMLAGGALLAGLLALVAQAGSSKNSPGQAALARRLCLAILFSTAFAYVVRDRSHVLGDSRSLLSDPVGSVKSGVSYTYLDELLGMWLPLHLARLRFLSGVAPKEAIRQGYQLVSVLSGALLVAALAMGYRRMRQAGLFSMLVLGNAAFLHYAGYVENYGTANLLLTLSFMWGATRLRDGQVTSRDLTVVTLCSSLAVLFHGVSVWCVLALGFLCQQASLGSLKRFVRLSALHAALGIGIIVCVVWIYSIWITPGVHSAHVKGSVAEVLASFAQTFERRQVSDHILCVLRVSTPALMVLLASLATSPRAALSALSTPDARFAWLWLLGFLIHQSVWKSTLGLQRDWDLFGFAWLPLAYLAWRAASDFRFHAATRLAFFPLAVIAGFSWVLRYSQL